MIVLFLLLLLKVEALQAENDFVNEQMTNMKGKLVIFVCFLSTLLSVAVLLSTLYCFMLKSVTLANHVKSYRAGNQIAEICENVSK